MSPPSASFICGVMYSSMATVPVYHVPFASHDQTAPLSFDGTQAHWVALASFIQSIAGDCLRVSDANDLPQLSL